MASTTSTSAALGAARWRLLLTGLVLAAVWWPARPGAEDDFPLSTYPMFGSLRGRVSPVRTVLGVRADGRRVPLSPEVVGGTGNPKQALAIVIDAVRLGRTDALCRRVARRVAATPLEPPVVALEVVTDTWDNLEALEPGAEPRRRRVHARCGVP